MTDYRDLGYNRFMENNPYTSPPQYSDIEVKKLFPPGSITLDRLSGGVLTLGGKDNERGSISIINESGDEIATIDSNGITP